MLTLVTALARRLWSDFDTLAEQHRLRLIAELTVVTYGLPLAVLSLVVLALQTDWSALPSQALLLLVLAALGLLLNELSFYQILGDRAGEYSFNTSSLNMVLILTGLFLVGAAAIWVYVFLIAVYYGMRWSRLLARSQRLNWVLNSSQNIWGGVFSLLAALALYQALGGAIPLDSLDLATIWPASMAVVLFLLLTALFLWLMFWVQARFISRRGAERRTRVITFFLLSESSGFFGILAAGLFSQNGWGAFLFFMLGVVSVSLLARRLSQAAMVSQQRSREVAQLEQLGRAIIAAPSDASTLPDLLTEHVPRMFQYRQVEIRVFSGPLLLHQPEHQPELGLETWSWLHDHPIYQIFEAGETLPWSGAALPSKVILAPMLTTDTAAPLGGICLLQDTNYAMDVSVDLQPALQTLAAQVASALHSAAVYRQTLEHQRSAQELAFAGQIQASFLPTSLPRIEGYQLAAALLPARETSGDFFDAIVLPNGRIGLLVADVSDKGMGAALYMALSRTLLRTFAFEYHTRPDFVLRVANRRILADTQAGLFVSVFYAVLDPYEATLSYCNGGHNPAYFFSRQSDLEVRLLRRTGMVLGVLEGMDWQQTILAMGPNDMLVIYSDGITDAQNVAGDFFGEQRLSAVLTENYGRHAQAVVDAVLAEVRAFVGDAPQFDDITLMVLAREATAPSLSQTPQPAIGSAPPIGYNTFGEAPHKTL